MAAKKPIRTHGKNGEIFLSFFAVNLEEDVGVVEPEKNGSIGDNWKRRSFLAGLLDVRGVEGQSGTNIF